MRLLPVRLLRPAFLSLAGAIVPFAIVWSLSLTGSPEDSGPRFFLRLIFGGIGSLILLFGLTELVDERHHRLWGSIVAFFAGIAGFFVTTYYGYPAMELQYGGWLMLQFLVYLVGPVLSFLGGLLGVFWKIQGTQAAPKVGLESPARLVLIGGSFLLVLSLPFLLTPAVLLSILALPALIVIVCGVLLYRARGNPRMLGMLVVAGSVSAGLPFYGILFQGIGFDAYYVWSLLATAGSVLGIIGGVRALRRGNGSI